MKKFILILTMAIFLIELSSCPALSASDVCLSFSSGKEINKSNDFLKFVHLRENEIKDSEFFSSNYDLDNDGIPEYFYYLENPRFCGMQTGCQILAYEYKNGIFRDLFEFGIFTNHLFDPRVPDHSKYICFPDRSKAGWARILIKNKVLFHYNGKYYIYKK